MITVDGTAEGGKDYIPKKNLITMKAHEHEREIFVKVVDDAQQEPDQSFCVTLCHEDSLARLPGCDT